VPVPTSKMLRGVLPHGDDLAGKTLFAATMCVAVRSVGVKDDARYSGRLCVDIGQGPQSPREAGSDLSSIHLCGPARGCDSSPYIYRYLEGRFPIAPNHCGQQFSASGTNPNEIAAVTDYQRLLTGKMPRGEQTRPCS